MYSTIPTTLNPDGGYIKKNNTHAQRFGFFYWLTSFLEATTNR